jgi:hypothetical protein
MGRSVSASTSASASVGETTPKPGLLSLFKTTTPSVKSVKVGHDYGSVQQGQDDLSPNSSRIQGPWPGPGSVKVTENTPLLSVPASAPGMGRRVSTKGVPDRIHPEGDGEDTRPGGLGRRRSSLGNQRKRRQHDVGESTNGQTVRPI